MSSDGTTSDLFVIPVSADWMGAFEQTVGSLYSFESPDFPSDLVGTEERVWGMMEGARNRTTFEQMDSRDWLIFYHGGNIFSGARVGKKFEGSDYGRIIWDSPPSRFCFTVEDFELLDISIEMVRGALGYQSGFYPRGPIRVSDDSLEALVQEYGSIRGFLDGFRESEPVDEDERASDYTRPDRIETQSSRIIRNTQLVKRLKAAYECRCQVCGDQRKKISGSPYAEGHHLQPLGSPHRGPDVEENIVILCPNHHADFDYGMIEVDPDSLEIDHAYDDEISGRELRINADHDIDPEFLRYHAEQIADW